MAPELDSPTATAEPALRHAAPNRSRIGLVLSGGGFRATLFHLGVIRFLRDAQLLTDVKHICSVSGGSIMAAHLLTKWHAYSSLDAREFNEAAAKLIDFIRRDVRDLVMRRFLCGWLVVWWLVLGTISNWLGLMAWLWSFVPVLRSVPWALPLGWFAIGAGTFVILQYRSWGRVGLLQAYYDAHLYEKGTLQKLQPTPEAARPTVDILATSLTTGELCSFSSSSPPGFHWTESVGDEQREQTHANGLLRVALGVAASSAFPAAFPPVMVDDSILSTHKGTFARQYLTDGGVYDNLGVISIQQIIKNRSTAFDFIFVSDAEGVFNKEPERNYRLLTARAKRTSDILMTRISKLEYKSMGIREYLPCKLEDVLVDDKTYSEEVDPATQRRLKEVRTDLNGFNDSEIYFLVGHGYAVARHIWNKERGERSEAPITGNIWRPALPTMPNPDALNRSDRRSLRNLLFDRRDRVSWWNLVLLIVPQLLLAIFFAAKLCWTPKPVGLEYEIHLLQQSEATGDALWLQPIVTSLLNEGKKEQEGNQSRLGDFRILKATTSPFKSHTRGLPARPFTVQLSSTDAKYRLAGGYAFRASGNGAEMAYRPLRSSIVVLAHEFPSSGALRVETITTKKNPQRLAMEFSVPDSAANDSLLLIVRLATATEIAFPNDVSPENLRRLIKLEVR
jgi:predicted acylesterase/phospholipase RssA